MFDTKSFLLVEINTPLVYISLLTTVVERLRCESSSNNLNNQKGEFIFLLIPWRSSYSNEFLNSLSP